MRLVWSLVWLVLLISRGTLAATAPIQFSAETFQRTPEGGEVRGKIYVGEHWMRTETYPGGTPLIFITDTEKKNALIIFTDQQSYMVIQGQGTVPQTGPGGEFNPCRDIPGAECKRLGEEVLAGRKAVKWEVRLPRQGGVQPNLQWVDVESGIVLRHETSDGQITEQRMLGMEKLDGRTVEKWEMVISNGDQAVKRSYRWFDPALKLLVREEWPGGYLRGMRNIRIEPQDPSLFSIPAGYKQLNPAMQAAGRH